MGALTRYLVIMSGALAAVGLVAPVVPLADIFNSLRPMIAGVWGLALVLALMAGRAGHRLGRSTWIALAGAGALHAVLLLVPIVSGASATAQVASTCRQTLRVFTFNREFQNPREAELFAHLRTRDGGLPDVVLLQEVLSGARDRAITALERDYPFNATCPTGAGCLLALFSRYPILQSGHYGRTETQPPLLWADLDLGKAGRVRVATTHIAFPLLPGRQGRHLTSLADFVTKTTKSAPTRHLIIAGDFNSTAWSFGLTRFAYRSGLDRHGTTAPTWPISGHWPNIPFARIDHLFATPAVTSIATRVGPNLGSDHLPVETVLSVPIDAPSSGCP